MNISLHVILRLGEESSMMPACGRAPGFFAKPQNDKPGVRWQWSEESKSVLLASRMHPAGFFPFAALRVGMPRMVVLTAKIVAKVNETNRF